MIHRRSSFPDSVFFVPTHCVRINPGLVIVVHSVVIGLSMDASDNLYTIRPLVAALCFHKFFEGMGLGSCILQVDYEMKMKTMMVFFFSVTTPFGMAIGIGLSNVYRENSPAALMVVGILDAVAAGLLNYMALVDLLVADFMGKKLQEDMKLQAISFVAIFLGAGGWACNDGNLGINIFAFFDLVVLEKIFGLIRNV